MATKIDFNYKTVNDPIHGSISLSRTEVNVIETSTFQRLRNLKQLGLADFVFPGATHSRFAHSLGVLHIVSRMLNAVETNHRRSNGRARRIFTDREKQKIRLAALLHDIGHLPLSHAMEQPIQRAQYDEEDSSQAVGNATDPLTNRLFGDLDRTSQASRSKEFSHESFGRDLLRIRRDIRTALGGYARNNEIGKTFSGARVDDHNEQATINKYSQFIKGTLDADRLDFLLRDSRSSGFSFGNIDLDYLLENLRIDPSDHRLYIEYKGVNALEHYITARYFSYNVTYHKTVMGFELMAKHVYHQMAKVEHLALPSSEDDLLATAKSDDDFSQLTDDLFWRKLREWSPDDRNLRVKTALLKRQPLLLLFEERELFERTTPSDQPNFVHLLNNNKFADLESFKEVLARHSLDRSWLAIAESKVDFEKYSAQALLLENPEEDALRELCKVRYNDEVQPLINSNSSIVRVLAKHKLWIRRLYYLHDAEQPDLDRKRIRRDLLQALK